MWKRYLCGRLVFVILVAVYGSVLILVSIAHRLRSGRSESVRNKSGSVRRVIVTGTFYHAGWFRSHLLPLGESTLDEIIVVADEPCVSLPKVRFFCPPPWARAVFGRALSKVIWMIVAGVRYPADVFMGYHIFPGGLSALLAASFHGKASCYQSTGGPIEVLGGGASNENWFMSSLGAPSAYLESLALRVVRRFDCVVVRGRHAKQFFVDGGLNGRVVVIPGSVDATRFAPTQTRNLDLVFVGRLSEIKQPWQFIEIVAAVRHTIPSVRAAVVGDGPLMPSLQRHAAALGVDGHIDWLGRCDDVGSVLARTKVFVLTSRSEGLSIALAEAMSCGLPAVVADVGELCDLVVNGATGWLVPPGDIEQYANRVISLLKDENAWRRFSRSAQQAAVAYTSVEQVARRWTECLDRLAPRRHVPLCGEKVRCAT